MSRSGVKNFPQGSEVRLGPLYPLWPLDISESEEFLRGSLPRLSHRVNRPSPLPCHRTNLIRRGLQGAFQEILLKEQVLWQHEV